MTPILVFQLLLLGACTGFLAGLLGIGGGMILVPFLAALLSHQGVHPALSIKMAIATSMATIVFTSLSSVRAHHKNGAVQWPVVRQMTPGILFGAALASLGAFALIKGAWLGLVFACFLFYSGSQMLRPKKPGAATLPTDVGSSWQLRGIGVVIGFVSGLIGAGGAFLSVPYLTRCRLIITQAIATSAALGFPIALANTLGFIVSGWSATDRPDHSLGYLYLPALLTIASASVLTAPLGAKTTHAISVTKLKQGFAWLLFALATYMIYKAWSAMTMPS